MAPGQWRRAGAAVSVQWVPLPSPATAPTPGAAGVLLRQRLRASPGTGVVMHAGSHAVYARVGGHVVGVTSRHATQVPAAIHTALPRLPATRVGDPAVVHDGALRVAGLCVRVTRVVPTGVPDLPDRARAARLLATALPDLRDCREQLPPAAVADLADGDPAAVSRLLGLGEGLTPLGDDVLTGWLVATRATGGDLQPVADACTRLSHRTTPLSAALLADAVAGECLPELRRLLLALRGGVGVAAAARALAAVGHTSGSGLLLGVDLALSAGAAPGGVPSGGGLR